MRLALRPRARVHKIPSGSDDAVHALIRTTHTRSTGPTPPRWLRRRNNEYKLLYPRLRLAEDQLSPSSTVNVRVYQNVLFEQPARLPDRTTVRRAKFSTPLYVYVYIYIHIYKQIFVFSPPDHVYDGVFLTQAQEEAIPSREIRTIHVRNVFTIFFTVPSFVVTASWLLIWKRPAGEQHFRPIRTFEQ